MWTTEWGFDEAVSQRAAQKLSACKAVTSTLGRVCEGVRRSVYVCLNMRDFYASYIKRLTLSHLVVASV